MDPKEKSEQFEKELDEFFKDRALERAVSSKPEKKDCDKKEEEIVVGSGCCMTGCHDCPWGFNQQ